MPRVGQRRCSMITRVSHLQGHLQEAEREATRPSGSDEGLTQWSSELPRGEPEQGVRAK